MAIFEVLNRSPIGSRTYFAPGVTRTHNLLIRSQMLYPIELRVRKDRQGNVKAREVKQTGKRCFLAFVCP
jgi:hypothetical protein